MSAHHELLVRLEGFQVVEMRGERAIDAEFCLRDEGLTINFRDKDAEPAYVACSVADARDYLEAVHRLDLESAVRSDLRVITRLASLEWAFQECDGKRFDEVPRGLSEAECDALTRVQYSEQHRHGTIYCPGECALAVPNPADCLIACLRKNSPEIPDRAFDLTPLPQNAVPESSTEQKQLTD